MTREEAKQKALEHYPDAMGPCDKPNIYTDDYRITLAQRHAYLECYEDMVLNNDKYQTVTVEALDALNAKAKAYDEFIGEKYIGVPALGTKYDTNTRTRAAYRDGYMAADNKYKKLVQYCKGILYHWGVEHDDALAGLAKLIEDLEK